MRAWQALRCDIAFQRRHGFYAAYAVLSLMYAAMLRMLPVSMREGAASLLTFLDPSAIGLVFVGGLILLERGQGLQDALFVTPLRLGEYLLSKGASLTLLALVCAWCIHLSTGAAPAYPLRFSLGVAGVSLFFTWFGMMFAAWTRTLNGYLIASQFGAAVFALPLGGRFGWWDGGWTTWMPTDAGLRLMDPAYGGNESPADSAVRLLLLATWTLGAYLLTERVYRRRVVARIGGGGGDPS